MSPKHNKAAESSRAKMAATTAGPKKHKKAGDERKSKKVCAREKKEKEMEVSPSMDVVNRLIPPVQEILDGLQAHFEKSQKQREVLRPPDLDRKLGEKNKSGETAATGNDEEVAAAWSEVSGAPAASAQPDSKSSRPVDIKARRDSLRVWKSFASLKLADMATSLDAALMDDSKLKSLFDKIDIDRGGSIDKEELRTALQVLRRIHSISSAPHPATLGGACALPCALTARPAPAP